MANCIDVSVFNGSINWSKVKASGIEYVIIRCGYGQNYTSQDDKNFKTYIDGALKAGLKVGMYLYSYAGSESAAEGEAKHAIRLAAPYKDQLSLPIFIDIEETSKLKYAKTVANAFCKAITNAGYKAGVYASSSVWNNYLKGFSGYCRWVAYWSSSKPANCDIWQYSEKGKVNGISGNVDLDNCYISVPDSKPKEEYKVTIQMTVLHSGSTGSEVKTVQRLLKELGYKGANGKALSVDGNFGSNTLYAVKKFQKDYKLAVDGWVGELTWNKLLKG